jgi:hypothetical protein
MFSFVLWAMVSRTKDYGMPHLCSWALDTMEYDGCRSHSSLAEGVKGEEAGLTLEEIAVKRAEAHERRVNQKKNKDLG